MSLALRIPQEVNIYNLLIILSALYFIFYNGLLGYLTEGLQFFVLEIKYDELCDVGLVKLV